jgi:hypothetical protein
VNKALITMRINPEDHIPSHHYCSLRYLVLGAGILSSMLSFLLMIIFMVLLVMDNTWHLVMDMTELWLQENRRDIKVCVQMHDLILVQIDKIKKWDKVGIFIDILAS